MKYAHKLLVSTPRSEKPHSTHTVVLVVEDHRKKGTFGLCINRPAPVSICTCGQCPVPPVPLFLGGPKHLDTRYFLLHDQPAAADKKDKILSNVFLSCPMALNDLGDGKGKMLTGYFQWLQGELHEEVEAGWWDLATPTHEQLFCQNPRHVWGSLAPMMYRLEPSIN